MYYMLPLSIFCSSISIFLGQYRDHLDGQFQYYDVLGRGDLWRRRRVAVDHEQGFFLSFLLYFFFFFFTIFFSSFLPYFFFPFLIDYKQGDGLRDSLQAAIKTHVLQVASAGDLNAFVFLFFFFTELYLLSTQHFGQLLLIFNEIVTDCCWHPHLWEL